MKKKWYRICAGLIIISLLSACGAANTYRRFCRSSGDSAGRSFLCAAGDFSDRLVLRSTGDFRNKCDN